MRVHLMEYDANLSPNGSLETRSWSPRVNINYPTAPIDNSYLEQQFRKVMAYQHFIL